MTDIEHFQINQQTEDAIELVLDFAKDFGVLEDDPEIADVKDVIPGGNLLRALDFYVDLADRAAEETKRPRFKKYLNSAAHNIEVFKRQQMQYHMIHGEFEAFPMHQEAPLSAHLRAAINKAE